MSPEWTRGEKYAEIRVQIRRLLADLLTTPDEDLIRQLHRTIRHIEQVLKRYDPEAAHLGGKLKKPNVRETQASLHESEQSGNSDAGAKHARRPR